MPGIHKYRIHNNCRPSLGSQLFQYLQWGSRKAWFSVLTNRSQDTKSKYLCCHCSGGIAALFGSTGSELHSPEGSLSCHWLCQLTGAQVEQHSDPKTNHEGLFPPALLTESMLKACCLPFLAWHKILARLPCWTSSESWQCGQYLLCWVLPLLTTEGEESSWVAHYPAIKSTALAVVRIRIHMKCWRACRHTKESILTKNRHVLLLGCR